ncbi:MAG TPA: hypothetical protein VGK99_08030 [Acidobacteriota bacterium]|jgi:hypothetical protein
MTPVDKDGFLPAASNCGSLRLLFALLGALALIACSHSAIVDSTLASEPESDPKVVQARQTAAPSQTALSLRKALHDGQYDKLDGLAGTGGIESFGSTRVTLTISNRGRKQPTARRTSSRNIA